MSMLTPAAAADLFRAAPVQRVAVRELHPAPTRTVGLAWRTSSARAGAYRRLAEVVRAAGEESMRP